MHLLIAYIAAVWTWAVAASFGAPHGLPVYVGDMYVGDKVVHFTIVGLFSLALARSFWQRGARPGRALVLGMVVAASAATIEELTNALTPHRSCSALDLVADYVGIATFAAIAWFAEFRRLPLSSKPAHLPVQVATDAV